MKLRDGRLELQPETSYSFPSCEVLIMKISRLLMASLMTLAFHNLAFAEQVLFTAHISHKGTILNQSPTWITEVKRVVQKDYMTEYTLLLDSKITQSDPAFCSMSPIDVGTYERLLHGQGKVIGKPSVEMVRVATQLVDLKGPSGDNSMAFQLMCVR
ncbi:hypothetical protein ACVWY1_000511 [Pseudomonas sp. TE6288]|jgi:hypothetical protein|uniref:hypothetical protein n=1 Tax=Pseudomonas TaxID=286 RepID=UPI0011182292|nr:MULTISPECIES: hypothetical protein [Pseudomonas]MDF9754199.1 hypothetical protein [Pseudomonas hunanensis]UVL19414.1 hypothetical protein LOY44_00425 [Pseudomonas sp. B21-044]